MVLVRVTDPQLETESRQQFTSYLVSSESTSHDGKLRVNTVRRRYSDFQWLYGRLRTELPGAVIPIIPHHRAISDMKRFDTEFIENRKRDLHRFLTVVVEHPELSRAPSMTPFMLDKLGIEFDRGKKQIEIEHPTITFDDDHLLSPSTATSATAAISGAKQGISNLLGRVRVLTSSKEKLMTTSQEKDVIAIREYLNHMELHVKKLQTAIDTLVQCTGDIAIAIESLGTPIMDWKSTFVTKTTPNDIVVSSGGKPIVTDDSIVDMMSAITEFSNDYSTLLYRKHTEEYIQFQYEIQCLSYDVRAFQVAYQQRKSWQVSYTTTYQQIIDKEVSISKSTKALKPPEVTAKLQEEKALLEKKATAEKLKLELSTKRFLSEFQRMQPRFELTFRDAIRNYATLQMSYTTRTHEAWNQLLPFVTDNISVSTSPQEQVEETETNTTTNGDDTDEKELPPMPSGPPPPSPPSSAFLKPPSECEEVD